MNVFVPFLFIMSQLACDLYAEAERAHDPLAPPTALTAGTPPGSRLFSERLGLAHLSFINMTKLKTFRRYEGCIVTLDVQNFHFWVNKPFKWHYYAGLF